MRSAKALASCIFIGTLAVFGRVAAHGFVTYDDPGYVTANRVVAAGLGWGNAAWAFASVAMSNWHPLTWLSHMLDVELFGMGPAGHHLMSVVLHAASAVVLFVFLNQATGKLWRSAVVAALFAVHPLHVESVAWVAERKDVLSGLFWHLSLLTYLRYVRRRSGRWYAATLASFTAGLLSKPMIVTLPAILLALDVWPLGRLRVDAAGWRRGAPGWRVLLEKAPFFALSALSSAVTIYAQHHGGSMVDLKAAPFATRGANALVSCATYLVTALWPVDLAVLYPLPAAIPALKVLASALLLGAITAWAWRSRSSRPYLAVGWCWYLVTLLPVIGLIQVGAQSHADRYTYLPLTGPFIAAVWWLSDALQSVRRGRAVLAATAAIVLGSAAAMTSSQLRHWRDSLTLYEHTLAVTDRNYLIMNNYGAALGDGGRPDEATAVLERAIAVEPRHAPSYYNLGRVYQLARQDPDAAAGLYAKAIELNPSYADAIINLGGLMNRGGQFAAALRLLSQAQATAAGRSEWHFNLGVSYAGLGDLGAAAREVEATRRLDPELAARLASFVRERSGAR